MNVVVLTLIATLSNVGTIACIKKCKYALLNGGAAIPWMGGIIVTILATQFLLLWADVKGASLGLAVSFVIVSVMIASALFDIDKESGRFFVQHPGQLPLLAMAGYGLAVAGVLLVGLSQR